jgi:cytoskeletal protein CcmA (bactofilin family)
MGDHIVEDDAFINSIVGEGTRFRGELDLNGLLRIDGDYSGIIRTPDKVLVGKNGRAECSIYAGTIVIGGAVKGNIYASEKIIILTTGMVVGNITTPRLIVEEGVILDGECRIVKDVNIVIENEEAVEQERYDTGVEDTGFRGESYPLSAPEERQPEEDRQPENEERQPENEEAEKQEGNTITVWNG